MEMRIRKWVQAVGARVAMDYKVFLLVYDTEYKIKNVRNICATIYCEENPWTNRPFPSKCATFYISRPPSHIIDIFFYGLFELFHVWHFDGSYGIELSMDHFQIEI